MSAVSLIETHFHLDYLKSLSPEEVLARARAVDVVKLITISVEPENFAVARSLASQFENLYCTQGVHPHDASKMTPEALQEMATHAREFDKCVGIGEIGLDYHYDHSPRDTQREVFRQQLRLACEQDLPVVVHSRDADEDTQAILQEFAPSLSRKGVIHSFTAGQKLAEFALEQGFCLGFNGIITFKNAQSVRDIVELAPVEQILIETDAPFLTPVPHRGKENGPCYLPLVAQKVAEIKGIELAELTPILWENSHRVFARLSRLSMSE